MAPGNGSQGRHAGNDVKGEEPSRGFRPASVPRSGSAPRRPKPGRKEGIIAACAVAAVLVVVYLAGAFTFMDRFMPRTTVMGEDVSFKTSAEVQDLLADGALLEEAFAGESTGEAFVTYRVPKFAFDSSYGLIPALERLGVVAAFGDQADFSNLSDTPAYVSSVAQESRIGLDENGVEASAYTKVDIMEMSALPDPSVIEELEFDLDRPFLYEIRTRQGIPLFVGLCAQPDTVA